MSDWSQWKVFKEKEEEYNKLRLDLEARYWRKTPERVGWGILR